MLRTSPPLRRTAVVVASGLLLGALAGCGEDTEPETTPVDSSSSTASESPSEPSGTPSSPPSATETGAPRTLAGRLLSADDLAATGATWSQGETGPAGTDPFGVCQEFDLATVGATRVLEQSFTAEDGAGAAEQLARFPDATNANRAASVVQSWHDSCRKRQGRKLAKLDVGPFQDVAVDDGTARWYRTSWVPADDASDGHVQTLGVAVHDRTLALVTLDHEGQAQQPDEDPMVAVLGAAADKLG